MIIHLKSKVAQGVALARQNTPSVCVCLEFSLHTFIFSKKKKV